MFPFTGWQDECQTLHITSLRSMANWLKSEVPPYLYTMDTNHMPSSIENATRLVYTCVRQDPVDTSIKHEYTHGLLT